MSEDVQTDDAKPASKPDEPAKTEEAKGNSATAVSTSKIDSLSRDDLVRLIRKQMVHLKDARKQLEELKKEKATDTKQEVSTALKVSEQSFQEGLSTTEMITMELKDYKTSLEVVKKKLAVTEVTISEKDTLLNEISTKLQTLNEEKAQLSEFLKQAEATRIKLDKELQEKNMMIAESQKEHQALSLGSEQIRSNLEDEIVTLQSSLRQAKDELANERKENLQKTTDLRSTREKCVSLECQLNDLRHEFNGFKMAFFYSAITISYFVKEKAQYVLKQKGEEQKPTAKNEEVEELIRTVSARNEKIATLTEKCSFLEEDRHAAKEYAKTLRAEIDEVNGELTKNRRSTEEAQRRLIRYEQTFKQNASTIEQLNQELSRLRKQFNDEKALLTENFQRQVAELNQRIKQLETELTVQMERGDVKVRPIENKVGADEMRVEPPKRLPRALPKLINFEQQLVHKEKSYEDDTLTNSKGDDSDSDDLQSLRHVVNCAVDGGEDSTSIEDVHLATLYSASRTSSVCEDWEVLDRQLRHTRDLLNETEEINVKLMEQVRVLKEEIRRLERSHEREQHLTNNEYFKNVMLKFLAPESVNDERQQLLPVLNTMLRLTPEEAKHVSDVVEQSAKVTSSNEWAGYFGPLAGIF
jgi:uncharacterized phage infection (PIP) family protein YhgE